MCYVFLDLFFYDKLSFEYVQVVLLPDVCGFDSVFYKQPDFLQVHVDKDFIKRHPVHFQIRFIEYFAWEIFHAAEHSKEYSFCLRVSTVGIISEAMYLRDAHHRDTGGRTPPNNASSDLLHLHLILSNRPAFSGSKLSVT